MNKYEVILPVDPNPGFEVECYHNFRLSILFAFFSDYRSWYCTHFVNLRLLTTEASLFPVIDFENHLDIYSDVLEEHPLDYSQDIIHSVISQIQSRAYVVMFLNWKNISGFNRATNEDLIHECLIYGYNNEKKVFFALAFEVSGALYGPLELSYEECLSEYKQLICNGVRQHQWFAYYGYPAATIRLKKYNNDGGLRKLYFAFDRLRLQSDVEIGQTGLILLGPAVSLYLSKYFEGLSEGLPLLASEYSLWNITMHKLMKHKKLMKERIEYMCQLDDAQDYSTAIELVNKCIRQLPQIRILSLKWQKTKERELLQDITRGFKSLYEWEKRLVPIMKQNLVNVRMKNFLDSTTAQQL